MLYITITAILWIQSLSWGHSFDHFVSCMVDAVNEVHQKDGVFAVVFLTTINRRFTLVDVKV